jgi:hypothetical protein
MHCHMNIKNLSQSTFSTINPTRLSWHRTRVSAASYQQLNSFLSECIRFIQSFATLCYTATTSCCLLCVYFHTYIPFKTSCTLAYTALSSHEVSKWPYIARHHNISGVERGTYSSRPVTIGGRRPKHITPVGYLTNCFDILLDIVVSRHRILHGRRGKDRV